MEVSARYELWRPGYVNITKYKDPLGNQEIPTLPPVVTDYTVKL